jgi:hypothetical protein
VILPANLRKKSVTKPPIKRKHKELNQDIMIYDDADGQDGEDETKKVRKSKNIKQEIEFSKQLIEQ